MAHDPLNPDNDPFGPPAISTAVHCIHCGEEYDSYRIEWRIEHEADGQVHGFWCCPMRGCDGKGFGFDIFPVDPDYRDENGELMWCSDESDEEDDEFDDEDDEFESSDSRFLSSEFSEFDAGDDDDEIDWFADDEAPTQGSRSEPEDDVPY
jgi:hypothetical protein